MNITSPIKEDKFVSDNEDFIYEGQLIDNVRLNVTTNPTPQKPKRRQSSNSAVYRFRIKGNGTAGGVIYADTMNVEVAVKDLGSGGSPFNNIVEIKFVEEFARKYNIEPRFHSVIKMLFKRDSVDVERI